MLENQVISIINIITQYLVILDVVNLASTCKKLWSQRSEIKIHEQVILDNHIIPFKVLNVFVDGCDEEDEERKDLVIPPSVETLQLMSTSTSIFKDRTFYFLKDLLINETDINTNTFPPNLERLVFDMCNLTGAPGDVKLPKSLKTLEIYRMTTYYPIKKKDKKEKLVLELPPFLKTLVAVNNHKLHIGKLPDTLEELEMDGSLSMCDREFPDFMEMREYYPNSIKKLTISDCAESDDAHFFMITSGSLHKLVTLPNLEYLKLDKLFTINANHNHGKKQCFDLNTCPYNNIEITAPKLEELIIEHCDEFRITIPSKLTSFTYQGKSDSIVIPSDFRVKRMQLTGPLPNRGEYSFILGREMLSNDLESLKLTRMAMCDLSTLPLTLNHLSVADSQISKLTSFLETLKTLILDDVIIKSTEDIMLPEDADLIRILLNSSIYPGRVILPKNVKKLIIDGLEFVQKK
jgi:hypothetical protein